ncbi:MAG: phenylalanine--tRNA ligase subunit beta [Clostridiales bacterium]|nr:phenylalanine--tRNA ligase subunit beta [Clostridiales bacterium]
MYISLNWIKDFVDLDGLDIKDITNKFTLSCAEIEGVEERGGHISGVISARIESVENHPDSKKLHILKVNTGKEVVQIVCGAPNVREGMVTALATIGAKLGDITIGKAKLAGVESYGMCCSGKELDITDDNSGILDLGDDTEIGVDLKDLYPINDTIIEIDNKSLTNRPDAWGHYGIAREIAAITGRKLKEYTVDDADYSKNPALNVKVESESCNRYSALRMENVSKNVSPMEMQIRLYYCGMRPISLLADLTNYIMLELGQPMHSFDGRKVESIVVRDVEKDTEFTTLDETKRVLPKGTMVIDLNSEIGAVAGIMGGLSSEIENDTTTVFLESANFDAVKVRKTATALGLRSESSARYEKSLDPEMTTTALRRYAYLLKGIDNGVKVVSNVTDVYPNKYPKIKIDLDKTYIDRYAGISIPLERIVSILESLGFGVKVDGENFSVDVPSYRATKDISIKADIVEEITRVYGYDNIKALPIEQPVVPTRLGRDVVRDYELKFALADKYNMHEIHSYIWEDAEANKDLGIETKSYIRLVNSLQKDNDDIRSTMLPTIIRAVAQNKRYANELGLFEVGHVVTGKNKDNLAVEEKVLGMGWLVEKPRLEEKMLEIKDIIHYLFDYVLGISAKLVSATTDENYIAPINYYDIVANGITLGRVGILHPAIGQKIDKDRYMILAEINTTKLEQIDSVQTKVEQVSKFPVTTLDFNFLLSSDELYSKIDDVAGTLKTDLAYKYQLLDIFYNKDNNTKSYTVRYFVTSMEHTLSSADIEGFHKLVIDTFEKKGIHLKVE